MPTRVLSMILLSAITLVAVLQGSLQLRAGILVSASLFRVPTRRKA